MPEAPRRRPGRPLVRLVVDAVRQARQSGNWITLWLIALVSAAALVAAAVYVVVPALIYPAL